MRQVKRQRLVPPPTNIFHVAHRAGCCAAASAPAEAHRTTVLAFHQRRPRIQGASDEASGSPRGARAPEYCTSSVGQRSPNFACRATRLSPAFSSVLAMGPSFLGFAEFFLCRWHDVGSASIDGKRPAALSLLIPAVWPRETVCQ